MLVISHGEGMHYLQGGNIPGLIEASRIAKDLAIRMNARKSNRAPKVRVTVVRLIEVYDGT